MEDETEVDVEHVYSAAMDSVNLINRMYDEGLTFEPEDLDTIDRNKRHLLLELSKDFWTDEDLTPLQEASERTE